MAEAAANNANYDVAATAGAAGHKSRSRRGAANVDTERQSQHDEAMQLLLENVSK